MIGNVAEVLFGKAIRSVMFDCLASVTVKFSQYVPQNNHRGFLSGAVVLEIFIFLVMIGNTFSERITVPLTNFLAIQILHLKH